MPYSTTQHPLPSPFSNVKRAARVAASKTSSTPSPLKLEHSRYLLAPTSRAAISPSWGVRNRWDFLRISSIATGSSRRSFFNPTRMMGTPAHSLVASSIHCAGKVPSQSSMLRLIAGCTMRTLFFTFSKESGVSTEKPIKMTCAFEYANGRSLS